MKKIINYVMLLVVLLMGNNALSQSARVQLIHNSADAAASIVDVYVNGTLLYDDFAFRTATPFADVPAGIPLSIDVAPGNSVSSTESIYNAVVSFAANETYVVVANGIVSPIGYTPSQPFELTVYAQAREVANSPGNTDLLVCHGVTDGATYDIVNTTVLPLTTLVDNIFYPTFSSNYIEVPTGNYTIDVTDQTGSTVISSYDVFLAGLGLQGQAITVVASGFVNPSQNSNGPGFGLWVALPTGGNLIALGQSQYARVQIIHNSPDAAAALVDVYIDGDLALDDFAFRTSTPFLDLSAGTPISIDIAPSTSTSVAESIYNLTTTLDVGGEYVIVANGIVSASGYTPSQPFGLSVFAQARETASNFSNTDVLINHGSPDAPTVDIVETSVPAGTIVDNISYPSFTSNYLELPTTDYVLNVTDASGANVVASYSAPLATLNYDGEAITVVASGFLNPSQNSNGPAFGLWVATHNGGNLIPLPLIPPPPTARVQVIHNSADAAAALVDVYLNGDLLLDDFAFRTASPFVDAPAGTPIQIDIAPSTSTSVAESIFNIAPTLTEGETYVLVANGIVSATGYTPSQPFGLSVFAQGRETASNASNTDILVNHGSTDAPTVDVVETSVPAGTIVDDISFPNFNSAYLELPTANYTLDVTDATGSVVVATYSAPLATLGLQGSALTVVASGFLDPTQNSDGPAFGLWVALPSGGNLIPLPLVTPPTPTARVQVIHNSADVAAALVDVYLNGSILLDDFAFRTATPFIDAPAGTPIQIDIAPSTSTSVAESIFNIAPTLTEGETYVLVANGIVSATGYTPSQPFGLSVFAQGRETASNAANTDVLVNHGSTDAPTVDVVETSVPAGTIVDDISFPNFNSAYLELPTANYTLDVTDATGSVVVATYSAPLATLGLQGTALTVVASGFLDPTQNSDGPAFGLWVALPSGGNLIPLPLVTPPTPTARVQVIHNSADVAAALVDVYLNGSILLDDFAFRTATPFIDAPAGTPIQIDIAPSTSTSVAESIFNIAPTLTEGETYVLVANGIVSATGYTPSQPFGLSVFAQGRETASNASNTDILVNHGSTDAPTVDVVETSVPAGTIVDDISFPNFNSAYLELPTANYTLDVTDATGSVVVATYSAPLATLGLQGTALTVVASGFLDPTQNSDGPAFGLWVALPSGGNLIPLPLVTPPTPTARVQVIHNSADVAAALVDVYLNGSILLDDFAFRTATPFIDAPAGTPIQIDIAPSTSTSVAESIFNIAPTLTEGETYVLVANGIVSATGYTPSQPFGLSVFAQGRETASNASNTDILVNHGSTDAPTVDVVETSVPAGTIVDDISFPNFNSAYLELPTANYTLDVTDATGSVVVATYSAPLATLGLQGSALTVVASGFLDPTQNSDGPAFGLWVALPSGGNLIPLPLVTPPTPTARVQVIHNSADAAAALVDVYLNGAILLDDFAFRTATPFIDAPAGTPIQIDIAPSTSTSVAESIFNIAPTLTEGETYVLVANGIVSATGYTPSQPFGLSVFAEGRETASNAVNTDILVNHGSTDAPTVDIVNVGIPNVTVVDDISFPNFNSAYLELPTSNYIIDVRDATGTNTVASYSAPLESLNLQGQAITVVASGFLDPTQNSDGPAFGLWVALASGGNLIPLPFAPLSTENFNTSLVAVSPNPVSDVLKIHVPFSYTSFSGTLTDMSGRTIKSLRKGDTNLDVSSLANGMYIVNLTIDSKPFQQKIVVSKK